MLPFDDPICESDAYLSRQLITYIGNKRSLLAPIEEAVASVCKELGKPRLRMLDGFAGSGVVSRLFKRYSSDLMVNDFEDYSRVVSDCYMTNRSEFPAGAVKETVNRLNRQVEADDNDQDGFIRRLYAPKNMDLILPGDRVFYTADNARRLDRFRSLVDEEPQELRALLLGPLLSAASMHANTAGVFKGFYKDAQTKVGRFGGSGSDALDRIMRKIEMQVPVLSSYECAYQVFQLDTNILVEKLNELDLAYFDPPYNQHPYGSNYFMLNLLVNYVEPTDISLVSGIPTDWQRSPYNVKTESLPKLEHLVSSVDARFVLLSYNDEGFIPIVAMRDFLEKVGSVREIQLKYATFRGSRNLQNRSSSVTEHLFLVDKRRAA
ncbi:MAG: DNA adenine methylase [Acidimicrobiales bacterium]